MALYLFLFPFLEFRTMARRKKNDNYNCSKDKLSIKRGNLKIMKQAYRQTDNHTYKYRDNQKNRGKVCNVTQDD